MKKTIIICIGLFIAVMPLLAWASNLNHLEIHIGSRFCMAALGTGGTIARALAATAVIFLAFSAFFGKINLMQIVIVAGGIGLAFSAAAIVDMFSGISLVGFNSTFANCAVAIVTAHNCERNPENCATNP